MDSSLKPRQFNAFRTSLIEEINNSNFGATGYRLGLAQYSEDVQVEFLLNAFQTKQQIIDGVQRFRLRPKPNQRHNMGGALQYAQDRFFTAQAGGRAEQGTRQVLVVVAGKDSDDDVYWVANDIRGLGTSLVGVGGERGVVDVLRGLDSFNYVFDITSISLLMNTITDLPKENVTQGEIISTVIIIFSVILVIDVMCFCEHFLTC